MRIFDGLFIGVFVILLIRVPTQLYAQSGDVQPVRMEQHRQTGSSEFKRERLIQQNGNAGNHVMLVEDYTYGGFSTKSPLLREALRQMDRWLLNLAKDNSDAPRSQRVLQAKPSDLEDACVAPGGRRINERQVYQQGSCNKYFPSNASPYLVAGMPVANNIAICQLKPIDPADYAVKFTADELDRLRRIFPTGVCDYRKPSVEQKPLMGTWLSYGPAGR